MLFVVLFRQAGVVISMCSLDHVMHVASPGPNSPAAHHVGRVFTQAGEAEVLQVGPLVGLVSDDFAVALFTPQVQPVDSHMQGHQCCTYPSVPAVRRQLACHQYT